MSRLALSLVALLAAATPAAAQIVAPAGRTLFNEAVLVRSFVRFDAFDEAEKSGDVERWSNVWALVWGAYPHLSVSLVAPIVRVETARPAGLSRRTGTADPSLFVRYDALRKFAPSGYTRLSPEVGIQVPAGGAFGNGSTDLLAGLILSHVRDPDWWVADLQWTAPGEGDGGLRRGDCWRADLAYLWRVLPRRGPGVPMVLLVAELNHETAARSRRAGQAIADSGGSVLFLSPGVEWIVARRVVLELSAPIALTSDLHGEQPQPEGSLILKARWLF